MAARKQPRRGATRTVDVDQYAREHPKYVWCRIWGHPWRQKGGSAIEYRNGQVVWQLVCDRCGATQELHTGRRTGEVEYRQYVHQEGYIWSGVGQQRPKSGELRVALAGVLVPVRKKKAE